MREKEIDKYHSERKTFIETWGRFEWDLVKDILWFPEKDLMMEEEGMTEDEAEQYVNTVPDSILSEWMYYVPDFPLGDYFVEPELSEMKRKVRIFRKNETTPTTDDILNLLILGKIKRRDAIDQIAKLSGKNEFEVNRILKENDL